jgi:hypothetical protein
MATSSSSLYAGVDTVTGQHRYFDPSENKYSLSSTAPTQSDLDRTNANTVPLKTPDPQTGMYVYGVKGSDQKIYSAQAIPSAAKSTEPPAPPAPPPSPPEPPPAETASENKQSSVGSVTELPAQWHTVNRSELRFSILAQHLFKCASRISDR